jgi:PPM family protein phosphatase
MNPPDSPSHHIEQAAGSDVGMRRANNQDSYTVVVASSLERFQKVGHLFVVADGMGAHAAGELASRIAVEKIQHYYLRSDGTNSGEALRKAVISANADIHRRGQENPEFHNMGTTASSLALVPEGALIAHVGDSRVYRLRGEVFEQLTFDHSLLWEMQAAGQVRPGSDLCESIPKNVITRSLGPSAEVAVDLEGPLKVEVGDKYLLCSDGLSGQVNDEEIGALLLALEPDLAVRVLIDLANLRGGPDNITIIVAKVTNGNSGPMNRPLPPNNRKLNAPLATLCGACLAAMIIFLAMGKIVPALLPLSIAITTGVAVGYQYASSGNPTAELVRNPVRSTSSPYRRYSAKPRAEMIQQLMDTTSQIARAATERRWKIDWTAIRNYEQQAKERMREGKLVDALRLMAFAINDTMSQLRNQQGGNASTSTVEY